MASKSRLSYGSEASPGKIFVGGLAKDTSTAVFKTYFAKYGTVTDDIIIKDKNTGLPRGFGFITFADPSVVDTVIEQTHIINNKQVEIKRTIPKGSLPANTKDFKTKKIFVGGLPATLSEDAFKDFFSKYGTVVEHQIIRDHTTNRSRGFGFIIFDNEQVVDDILVKGNMIDMTGAQVEIKKAEPKKPSNQPSASAVASDPRAHSFGDGLGALDSYSAFDGSAFAPGPLRAPGAIGSRFGNYGYGGSSTDFGVGYGGIGGSGLGGFRGDPTLGFSSRYGSYGAGLGGGYGAGGLGGYGRGDEAYPGLSQGYGGSGFDSGLNSSYGGAGGLFGSRTGYSGSSRYHPYSR